MLRNVMAVAAVMLGCWCSIFAFGGEISTVAGTGKPAKNGDEGIATELNIGDPFGVELGPDGGLYFTEIRNHRVWRLDLQTGRAKVVAGNGQKGYAGDGGPATAAKLNEPYEVRFDRAGNMLFVEMQNHLVRKVEAKTGLISTVAGTGEAGFSGDGGPATKATFRQPHSLVLDAEDNLFVADILNHRIRRIDARTGTITSIAGNGEKQMPQAGELAKDRPMIGPRALYLRGDTLWIALREGHSVWELDLKSGKLRHLAGTGKAGFTGDGGLMSEATFDGPKGIALSNDEKLYVVDTENHAIRCLDLKQKTISTVAGKFPKERGGSGDGGPATQATLDRPHGIGIGPEGALYIGDTLNHRVRKVLIP